MRWLAIVSTLGCLLGCGVPTAQCSFGASECQGNAVFSCVNGRWSQSQVCSTAQTCNNGQCVSNTACTERTTQCKGNAVYTCTNGALVLTTTCNSNQSCSAGACVTGCTTGATQCQGNDVYTCSAQSWTLSQHCTGACSQGSCTTSGVDGGSTSADGGTACTSGTYECRGGDLYGCINGKFVFKQTCSANAAESCSTTGSCVCSNNAVKCGSTSEVDRCVGGRWLLDSRCEAGFTCTNGTCACTSGATTCYGNDLYTCNGGVFSKTQTCATNCQAGKCVAAQCANGDRVCSGNDLYVCSGGTWSGSSCGGQACFNGACVASCSSGTYGCSGNDVWYCSNGAWAYQYTCLQGYTCGSGGSCVANCTAGDSFCSGQDVYSCSGGSWVYQQTCLASEDCSNGRCITSLACGLSGESCHKSGDCADGYTCLDTAGYACPGGSAFCQCSYGACGTSVNDCYDDLDCCPGYLCNGSGYCQGPYSCLPNGSLCRSDNDCCGLHCSATDSCSGTCN